VFSSPGGALMAVPTWADALREGQSVQVALGAVAVVCIGVGAVHVGAVQVNDHGQVELAAECGDPQPAPHSPFSGGRLRGVDLWPVPLLFPVHVQPVLPRR
jgi:hypothetical protein